MSSSPRGGPDLARQAVGVIADLAAQQLEQRLLQRQDEGRRLAGTEALHQTRAGQFVQQLAHRRAFGCFEVVELTERGAAAKLLQEAPCELPCFGLALRVAKLGIAFLAGEPIGQQPLVVPVDQ